MTKAPKSASLAVQKKVDKKISNHLIPKTAISRLFDARGPENYLIHLGAHNNLQSLKSYKLASITQRFVLQIWWLSTT